MICKSGLYNCHQGSEAGSLSSSKDWDTRVTPSPQCLWIVVCLMKVRLVSNNPPVWGHTTGPAQNLLSGMVGGDVWGCGPLLSAAVSSQVKKRIFSRVSNPVYFSKWPTLPVIVLEGGLLTCDLLPLLLLTLRGRRHSPEGHTCRKYCPESCGFHCSSSSECLWPLRKAQRGRLALSSRSHSLSSSVAAAFSSSGDCNTIIPRKVSNRGRRGTVILRPAELVGT